jgi:hypothetical protein
MHEPMEKIPNRKFKIIFFLVTILLLSIPIGFVAFLGSFSRFHADDFCAVGMVYRLGFWKAAQDWYINWTGRYAFIYITQVIGLGGPNLAQILPAAMIATWLAGFFWLFRCILRILSPGLHPTQEGLSFRITLLPSLALSVSTVYSILLLTPNLFQSVLWQSGSINNMLPLIVLTYNLTLMLRTLRSKDQASKIKTVSSIVLITLLAFFASGFHEGFTVFQLTLFTIFMGATAYFTKGHSRRFAGAVASAGIVGGITGLAIAALAPGNTIRQITLGAAEYPGLAALIQASIHHAYITGHALIKHFGFQIGVILLTSSTASFIYFRQFSQEKTLHEHRVWWLQNILPSLVMLIPMCFILVAIFMAPAEYFFSSYPDPRALIIPLYAIVLTIIIFGLLLGLSICWFSKLRFPTKHHRMIPILLILLLTLISYSSSKEYIEQISESRSYALRWDQRDETLKEAHDRGIVDISAAGLSTWNGVQDLAFDADFWINRCLAWYYGFERVQGR